MKISNIFRLGMLVVISVILDAHEEISAMQSYHNIITELYEIHGTTTYSLVIRCDQLHPIITYAPASYEESVDSGVVRLFMPNTTFSSNFNHNCPNFIYQRGVGIEIVLIGSLQEKIVGCQQVLLTISRK